MYKFAVPIVLLALAGCQSSNQASMGKTVDAPPTRAQTVQLLGANNELRGTASLEERASGLGVTVKVEGLAAGTYAIHFHRVGLCTPPAFESAGPHFNPTTKQHGRDNPMGPHLGDLPNITVGADGTGGLSHSVAGLTFTTGTMPLIDADGAAVVLHAGADDYRTDPSGNSGARIACGTLAAK